MDCAHLCTIFLLCMCCSPSSSCSRYRHTAFSDIDLPATRQRLFKFNRIIEKSPDQRQFRLRFVLAPGAFLSVSWNFRQIFRLVVPAKTGRQTRKVTAGKMPHQRAPNNRPGGGGLTALGAAPHHIVQVPRRRILLTTKTKKTKIRAVSR